MGQIEDLRLFATIVEQGSISKAATKAHIAKSAVSRRLSLLEQRMGARLIAREPGHWDITSTGRELYQRALDVLTQADELENDFTQANQSLAGPLIVSLPREFGLSFLTPALLAFNRQYPDIQLMVDFDDRKVDLARENYDFAIRITPQLEPHVVGRKIGTSHYRVCASRAYLQKRGTPKILTDLEAHDILEFGAARRSRWSFKDSAGAECSYEFQPSLNSNSGVFLLDAARSDLGVARLPDFIFRPGGEMENLVPILTDYTSPQLQIFLIHSEKRWLNRRMRLFADAMELACAPARVDHKNIRDEV